MIYKATYRRPVRKVDTFHTSELSLPIFVPDECFEESSRGIREVVEKMAPEGYNLVNLVVFEEPKKVNLKKKKVVKEPETLRDRMRKMTPRGVNIVLRRELDKAFDEFTKQLQDYERDTWKDLGLTFVCPICIAAGISPENAVHDLTEAFLPSNESIRRYGRNAKGLICQHCKDCGF